MRDAAMIALDTSAVPPPKPPRHGIGRFTLDIRQTISPWKQAAIIGGSLAIGLAISVLILDLAGIAPVELARELAGVFNADSLRAVLVRAAPLILVGLSAALAFRIGFWNLGLEGQMIFGGIFATAVSIYNIGPESTRVVVMGLAASIGGTAWVLLAYWMKIRFRVNEIISTLLMNYIASYFLLHLLYGAWQDSRTAFPQSSQYRPFERLSEIGYGVNSAVLVALAIVVVAAWAVHLSRAGFYMRFISANTNVATVVGVPVRIISLLVIAASGAAAGIAGFVNVTSQEGRLTQSFFDGYVFSGILIAFLSRNDPIVVVFVGFLLAVLFIAGQALQVFYQIPFTMVQLVEAIIVIAVASSEFLIRHRIRWTR